MTEDTAAKHLRQIRALLHRVGPNCDPKRPSKGLIDTPPLVVIPKLEPEPKSTFTITQVRQLIVAAEHFPHPDLPDIKPRDWWRAYFGVLYCTGLRSGTAAKIEWPMLGEEEDGWWLNIPRKLVPKTCKGKRFALPAWCGEALVNLPRMGLLLLPYPRHKDTLGDDHKDLQRLAGFAEDRLFAIQAWRRFHCDQMERLGLSFAREIGRRALDHADSSTTSSHYVDLENELRRQLPCLWDRGPRPNVQRHLFD